MVWVFMLLYFTAVNSIWSRSTSELYIVVLFFGFFLGQGLALSGLGLCDLRYLGSGATALLGYGANTQHFWVAFLERHEGISLIERDLGF